MLDWAIVAARLLQFGSALVLFGSALFYLYGFRTVDTPSCRWGWAHLTLVVAAIGALVGVVVWIIAQTGALFSDFDEGSVWIVLTETGFGRIAFSRLGLTVVSLVVLVVSAPRRSLWLTQSLLGAAIVATFAWTGHGVRDDALAGMVHLGSDVLHLLASGIWIGALLPLSLLALEPARARPTAGGRVTYDAFQSFSGVGPAVVSILILTGLLNSWFLIGLQHWRELFTSPYGLALMLKLALFAGMLALAAVNRFRLLPQLGSALTAPGPLLPAFRVLKMSVLAETGLALLVLAAVALLGTLEPPG